MTTLSAALWRENEDLATTALQHPFVRGLADGSLPTACYAAYTGQDAFFLGAFADAYSAARSSARDAATRDVLARLIDGVRDKLRLHASVAAGLGIDLSSVEAGAATLAYTDFRTGSRPTRTRSSSRSRGPWRASWTSTAPRRRS